MTRIKNLYMFNADALNFLKYFLFMVGEILECGSFRNEVPTVPGCKFMTEEYLSLKLELKH